MKNIAIHDLIVCTLNTQFSCITGTALTLAGPTSKIGRDGIQCDLPTAVAGKDGKAYIAYLEWAGEIDRLILSRETEKGLQQVSGDVAKGVLHKPAIAIDGKGTAWILWGETHKDTTVNLKSRSWSEDKGFGAATTIADSDAAEAPASAATPPALTTGITS